jgi:hypothetical protein
MTKLLTLTGGANNAFKPIGIEGIQICEILSPTASDNFVIIQGTIPR